MAQIFNYGYFYTAMAYLFILLSINRSINRIRPYDEVRRFVFEIIKFLNHQEVKMLVIACNTATVAGLKYYQEACKIPVLGVVEPRVKDALNNSKNKVIEL